MTDFFLYIIISYVILSNITTFFLENICIGKIYSMAMMFMQKNNVILFVSLILLSILYIFSNRQKFERIVYFNDSSNVSENSIRDYHRYECNTIKRYSVHK